MPSLSFFPRLASEEIEMGSHLKVLQGGRGFSLIELLIVIAIGTVLLALTLPVGFSFYRSVISDDVAEEIATTLRKASEEARMGKNDIVHGVYFGSSTVTHFQGVSYALRVAPADEVTGLQPAVTLTGFPAEVTFAKVTGMPSATGTLVVSLYGYTHQVKINSRGVIDKI